MEKWDYFKVDSKWNEIELDKQMSILEKYYPVGDYFYDVEDKRSADAIAFVQDMNNFTFEHKVYYKVVKYVIHTNPFDTGEKWFLIEYLTYDNETNDLVRYNDTRHPGFFYPAVKLNRTNKLNKLIE